LALQKYGYLRKIAKNACSCLPAAGLFGCRQAAFWFFLKKISRATGLAGRRNGQPAGAAYRVRQRKCNSCLFLYFCVNFLLRKSF
jgi:hypothetical protein